MNKFTKLLIGITVFIFLFYKKEPGLNVGLFALAVWAISYFTKSRKSAGTSIWILSAACWVSSLSLIWYGDGLSLAATFLSTAIFAIYAQYPGIKLLLYPVIAGINVFSFPFRVFMTGNYLPRRKEGSSLQKWIAILIIPFMLVVVFALVYATGSDIFSNFLEDIVFNFSLWQIILLGILSFIILFNLWVLWIPRGIIKFNAEQVNDLVFSASKKEKETTFLTRDQKLLSGKISFLLLNLLLLTFIIVFNYEQFSRPTNVIRLSDDVHQRIGTVIGSIVMAIALILFYFNRKLSEDKDTRSLRQLAFAWIILNAILVLSAFLKNIEYVISFGLTFKRISVFIFLILCITGLYLTFKKIYQQKTNFYLVNKMAWILYFTLIITAPVNFSWITTKYNITMGKSEDIYYLQRLDYNQRLLFDVFKNDPSWQPYIQQQAEWHKSKKNTAFLSSFLYYKFVVVK